MPRIGAAWFPTDAIGQGDPRHRVRETGHKDLDTLSLEYTEAAWQAVKEGKIRMMYGRWKRFWGIFLLVLLAGCAVNPVTGKKELALIGEAQELAIGKKNYGPYRQAQGGDYTADPALLAYVQRVGQRLAAVSDRRLPYEFRVVNDSSPNAWALPGGKIAVNRGLLLALQDEAELAAVLAHEIVHAAARHTAQSMQRGIFLQGALMAVGVALKGSDYQQQGNLGATIGADLVKSHFSREAESEADAYGMRYMLRAGYDPAAAVSLQETFVRLFEDRSPDWLDGLFASHPPSRERVAANRRLLAKLGEPGGERGRERYRLAIAHLRQVQPAYEAYTQACKALEVGNMQRALALLDKAMHIEPKEALFPILRGEIHKRLGHQREALYDFDHALALNPDYYLSRVQRGLLEHELGRHAEAERDLEASIVLLPTADAYYGLGLIAEQRGRTREALGYFQAVATSGSTMSEDAAQRLALLDLADHPDRYLKVSLGLHGDGHLLLRLRNASAVSVHGIQVVIGRSAGRHLEPLHTLRLRGRLPAGGEQQFDTGLRLRDAAETRGLVARVIAARPQR